MNKFTIVRPADQSTRARNVYILCGLPGSGISR